MTALDILADSFPHGTPEGYGLGCRTNHCPAPVPCHVVRVRYAGDVVFRRRVDEGWTLGRIVETELAEAATVRLAERAANRAIREATRRKPKKLRTFVGKSPVPYTPAEVNTIRELNAAGWTDTDIADHMGRPFGSLTAKRSALGLPRNKRQQVIPHGTYAGYAAGCRDACCHEPAKEYWRQNAENKRRRDGVPTIRQKDAA